MANLLPALLFLTQITFVICNYNYFCNWSPHLHLHHCHLRPSHHPFSSEISRWQKVSSSLVSLLPLYLLQTISIQDHVTHSPAHTALKKQNSESILWGLEESASSHLFKLNLYHDPSLCSGYSRILSVLQMYHTPFQRMPSDRLSLYPACSFESIFSPN